MTTNLLFKGFIRVFCGQFCNVRASLRVLVWMMPLWLLLVWCTGPQELDQGRNLQEDRALGARFRNIQGQTGYVGKEVCRNCHAEIYDTYMETGMGRSWGLAPEHSRAPWDGPPALVHDTVLNLTYQAFRQNESMFVREFRLDQKGDTVHNRLERVDMVVGSGQHTNSHLRWRNGMLCQLPLTYYTQEGRWDLPPGYEKGNNARFSRPIEAECIQCHNAHPVAGKEAFNHYLRVPEGIDCERCHGPGALHVAEKSRGQIIDTSAGPDYSIVNPRRLSPGLQNDLCKRCHLQGNAVLKPGKTFADFKPGMVLSDVLSVFLPRHRNHEDFFIMASHPDRLAQSACLTKEPLSLRCISCHNPHRSVLKTDAAVYDRTCHGCHGDGQKSASSFPSSGAPEAACSAPLKARRVQGNRCVACHMPKSGSSDIPHVRITDHKIQVPPHQGSGTFQKWPERGALLGLASLNESRPDPMTLAKAWLQYVERFDGEEQGLDSAKRLLEQTPMRSRKSVWVENQVHWMYLSGQAAAWDALVQSHANFVKAERCDAWTAYRIGELLTMRNDPVGAAVYLQRAVDLVPGSSDFVLKLALNEHRLSRREGAMRRLQKLTETDPDYVPAYANLGFMFLESGQPLKANDCYNKALRLDPDHVPTLMNRIGLRIHQGQKKEAIRLLDDMLKRYPGDPRALALKNQIKP